MRHNTIPALLFLLLPAAFLNAQSASYADVAVIVNDSSPVSMSIGSYFQAQRNIPAQNIIHVSAPLTEGIDSLQMLDLAAQVKAALNAQGIADSVQYLVTTKGLPAIVNSSISWTYHSSVESELALINSPWENSIGLSFMVSSPYSFHQAHFDRSVDNIYICTRLDGYSENEVIALIDRSGPGLQVDQSECNILIDVIGSHHDSLTNFTVNSIYSAAANDFTQAGWNVIYSADSLSYSSADKLIFYQVMSFDQPAPALNLSFAPGGIVSLDYCFTSTTFTDSLNPQQTLILPETEILGGCGGKGNVAAAYLSPVTMVAPAVLKYLDPVDPFNLGEALYKSFSALSSHNVPLGDPKTSLVVNTPTAIAPPLPEPHFMAYPNPARGEVWVKVPDENNSAILRLLSSEGKLLLETSPGASETRISLEGLAAGLYFIQCFQAGETYTQKLLIAQ